MKLKEKIKYYLPNILFVLIAVLILGWLSTRSSYFDPINFCLIKLDGDVSKGNIKTIKLAIKKIKNQNPDAYLILCKNVKIIRERYCLIAEESVQYTDKPGCYIKGSHTVYLRPEREKSDKIIDLRMNTLKILAEKCRNFWQQR